MRVELYRDPEGRYRWRRKAGNNRTVGASEQSFKWRWYCRRDAKRDNPGVEIIDLT